jgi:hypothetical protein
LPNAEKDCVELPTLSFIACGSGHDLCSIDFLGAAVILKTVEIILFALIMILAIFPNIFIRAA